MRCSCPATFPWIQWPNLFFICWIFWTGGGLKIFCLIQKCLRGSEAHVYESMLPQVSPPPPPPMVIQANGGYTFVCKRLSNLVVAVKIKINYIEL